MLNIIDLIDNNNGQVNLYFFLDFSKRNYRKYLKILLELMAGYISNNYSVESNITANIDTISKLFKDLISENKKNDFTVDGFLISWEYQKGYSLGLTQKKIK